MAINQNHLFEELNGIKCAIVEKNASPARTDFLRRLLEYNRYTVVVVPSPPPKAAAAAAPPPAPAGGAAAVPAAGTTGTAVAASGETVPAAAASGETVPAAPPPPPPPPPETFTIGVTDVGFNPTNAVFGRLLKTSDGHIVTLAYWQQKAVESNDEIPYFAS
jgi:hypothetical protein